jgi:NRPS condensation-like uncharacterized protein
MYLAKSKKLQLAVNNKMAIALNDGAIWYRLDNAAKIYPALLNAKDSCVFRVAALLKEAVIPEQLHQAVIDCKPRLPSFFVKLKTGLFWNYFEDNPEEPLVKPEPHYINQHIDLHKNNGYHFTVYYYEKRISLETFHSLCDGAGALEFLKAIVFRYFERLGYAMDSENRVMTVDQIPEQAEIEDGFARYYLPTLRNRCRVSRAYRIQGVRLPGKGDIGVINGKMQVESFVRLARNNQATLAQYLAALLTYCIGLDERAQSSRRPINISIPVNLRLMHPSRTLRNFSLFFYTSTKGLSKNPDFTAILEKIKKDFRQELNDDKLQQNLNANVAIERSIALRMCPLFIKNVAIRIACGYLGSKMTSSTMSNMGRVSLPSSMEERVEDFECNMSVGNRATHNVCVISYGDKMTISFSRAVYETDLERHFFTYLAAQGLDIEIQSNLRENLEKG